MTVPSTSGPASLGARLVITAPGSAAGGATLRVHGRVEVGSDAPRIVTVPARSQLLITRAGRIVVRSDGAADPEIPLVLRAGTSRPAQALPVSVRLATPDEARLPPGEYAVVGVLAYGSDPLQSAPTGGTGRAFALVSDPVPITVG
ncbi:MAG TPA: hypothetical protein VGN18_12380 [Jatrophihabitans sp.]|jgi:hypothetical protein|uniref:hypothetical protein n=1 Tax=Jatrophihabitans sp. TaxID=1932789 RepID=UPI002E025FE7|nr:hypothetical protein [Jatrophihabitans sp.]